MLPYKDSSRSPAERTADLLARMTLAEKAAQMMCVWQKKAETLVDESGDFDAAKARAAFEHGNGIGQVGRPSDAGGTGHEPERGRKPAQMAQLTNDIQRFFIEESRLGIPVIFHDECLHGHAAVDGTSFPQPIALGSTFDPELVERLYTMTAHEARSRGVHQALTPVVDVARDPRWGRVEETFGEDPYLVSRMGVAAVRGFQGDATFRDKTRVIATMKHFVAHGAPEAGQNCAPANVSVRELREVFLPPFKAAIEEAGALSVMPSYNEVDGVPSHANRWLLRDVLRGEWGFRGFTVSDYYAIWELNDRPDTHGHFLAGDKREAARLAVRAGVNSELPEPDCYLHLVELVQSGELAESDLDDLVAPMLRCKFELGLFDDPYVDVDNAVRVVGSAANRALSMEAAVSAITLLKNDASVLPFDATSLKTIAVIGPNSNRPLHGGYTGAPSYSTTVLDGIRARAGKSIEVVHAEGCRITVGGSWYIDEVIAPDPEDDRRQIAEAVEVAKSADVIVLALGGNEQTSREAWNRAHMGDRTSLDLIGRQDELLAAMVATGKPVVVLLFNGRPLSVTHVNESAAAILECWYLGQDTGSAVAQVLFGDANPGGKLPITVPRSVGHIPAFYNHKPSARRGYLFADVTPLYPFGFGLSYTTFELSNVRLAEASITKDGTARVSVDVRNAGAREGTEVVQVYVRDLVSSVTRPVKELKAFRRVSLPAGESITVTLELGRSALAFYDISMQYVVEPGDFSIMVGTSSRDADLVTVKLSVV